MNDPVDLSDPYKRLAYLVVQTREKKEEEEAPMSSKTAREKVVCPHCHHVWGEAPRIIPEDVRGGWLIPSDFPVKWSREEAGYLIYVCPECGYEARAMFVGGQPKLLHWNDQPGG
jgi:DNA-directed RNA polymerase subunit RPC12/RpoP